MYVRKTRDEYAIEADYGYGWERVTSEDTLENARERLKEYRENEKKPVRIRKRRVPIEAKTKESAKLAEQLDFLKDHRDEIIEGYGDGKYCDMIRNVEKLIRIEKNRELDVGDGATVNYYTDRHACTVIRKTKRMIVLQRDKATLKKDYKPDFVVGGFAGYCLNNHEQNYDYQKDLNGVVYKAYWREKKGCYVVQGCMTVSVGRHEFYDYNF